MTTTEQHQAGSTEREAVERMARWLGYPEYDRYTRPDATFSFDVAHEPGRVFRGARCDLSESLWDFASKEWNPFIHPADERDLWTAAQERWGRPAVERHNLKAQRRWGAYLLALRSTICERTPEAVWRNAGSNSDLLSHAYIAPGDIARAVDAVLREYGE